MNVYLVGMPGSGKSSVGRALARRVGWPFVDLDADVEAAAGKPVSEIFERDGEPRFRALEREALERVAAEGPAVVACGGGVVLDPANRRLLQDSGTVVLLSVPVERLRARIRPGSRPLVGEPEDVERLLAERDPLYREVADRVIDATAPAARVATLIQRGLP